MSIFDSLFGRGNDAIARGRSTSEDAAAIALVREFGTDNIRKAMGLYNAALKRATSGGEIIFRDADGHEKKWRPRP